MKTLSLILSLALLPACALSRHPSVAVTAASVSAPPLAEPGPLTLESVVSARWSVPLSGLVNLENPDAAGLVDGDVPIVLPVHVLTHPERGAFVIDTGAPADLSVMGPLVGGFLGDMEVVDPMADILARQSAPLAGVLITHMHLDHILGLADIPVETPIYAGPGELEVRQASNALLRRPYKRLLDDRAPLQSWDWTDAGTLGGLPAIDVLGDGSLWALSVPGHTPGSTAYLARTVDGPVLFTGDCAHLQWSWTSGVEAGSYTADHAQHRQSLAALRQLAAQIDGVQVFTGHELTGEDTGVDMIAAR
ncbi:MAG: MBL fold metallo-hydrolase [Alphaproteobacteria bacterium]|nr:MBL fold metallo-hydrolase [Alphaproteobacteria bacterium]